VDINLLRAQLSLKPYQFYLCGPTALLESLVPALDNWGVQEDHIHFEAFGPSSIKRATKPLAEPTGTQDEIWVNFARSGKRLRWQSTDASLLEFAEANDIAIDSGCRAGCCGSCQTRLSVGEVNYLQSPEFELGAGNCLPCVCTPKNNLTLEL
jgi:ferredoxin